MTVPAQATPSDVAPAPGQLKPVPPVSSFGAREEEDAARVIWSGSQASQRAAMRALHDTLGDDPDVLCRAYVEAERSGVPRTPGAEAMAPLFHARMLWREGKLTGWLSR